MSIDIKCANGAVYSSDHTSDELLNGDAVINYMPLTDVIEDQVESIYTAYSQGYDKTTTVEEYNASAIELFESNITITLPETDVEGLTFDITLTSNGKSIPLSTTYNY